MQSNNTELVEQLNNGNIDVRFNAVADAESGIRNGGSHDALYALVYALGDKDGTISGTASEVLSALLNEKRIITFSLSNIGTEIGGDKTIEGARKEKIKSNLREIISAAAIGMLGWKAARMAAAGKPVNACAAAKPKNQQAEMRR